MTRETIRVLLIGPLTKAEAGLLGGATVSFGQLVAFFRDAEGVRCTVVDTQAYTSGFRKRLNVLWVLYGLLVNLPGVDVVMLNSSRGGTRFLAPLLSVLTRIWRRRFVFRPFGGDIKDYTAAYGRFERWLFQNTVLKADLLFLQTRQLMEFYAGNGVPMVHLPTSRPEPPASLIRAERPFGRRFVFMGHVKRSKGIDEILEVAAQLPKDYTFHIYGTIEEERYRQQLAAEEEIYRGVLAPREVLTTLSAYDVLVLPTYYGGEGYPGVIIEAFSLGLPVITTHWKALPELVRTGVNGQLISPRSVEALLQAIQTYNSDNYAAYSANARAHFEENFREKVVLGRVLQTIKKLV